MMKSNSTTELLKQAVMAITASDTDTLNDILAKAEAMALSAQKKADYYRDLKAKLEALRSDFLNLYTDVPEDDVPAPAVEKEEANEEDSDMLFSDLLADVVPEKVETPSEPTDDLLDDDIFAAITEASESPITETGYTGEDEEDDIDKLLNGGDIAGDSTGVKSKPEDTDFLAGLDDFSFSL